MGHLLYAGPPAPAWGTLRTKIGEGGALRGTRGAPDARTLPGDCLGDSPLLRLPGSAGAVRSFHSRSLSRAQSPAQETLCHCVTTSSHSLLDLLCFRCLFNYFMKSYQNPTGKVFLSQLADGGSERSAEFPLACWPPKGTLHQLSLVGSGIRYDLGRGPWSQSWGQRRIHLLSHVIVGTLMILLPPRGISYL